MRRPAFSRYVLYIFIRLSIYLRIYIYVDIHSVSLANVIGIKLRLLRSPVWRFLCTDRRSHDTHYIYISVYLYIYIYLYVDIHIVSLANVIGIKLGLLRSPVWRFLCADRRSHDTYSIYLSVYRYIYMYIYVDIHSVPLANVIGIKLHLLRSPAWRFLCANRRSHDT